jgi:osmotically-inducible protein OsmY
MMRGLIRAILVLVVIVAAGFFLIGYWASGSFTPEPQRSGTSETSGTVDVTAARERGAELAQRAAYVAATVNETIDEAALTGKIKAKMVLDDLVKARSINVTTSGSTSTLTGKVYSEKERERAVQLARETEGVTEVVDRLVVEGP